MMGNTISIALTGMDAALKRLHSSANNVANAHTSGTLDGTGKKAYTPQTTVQSAAQSGGVKSHIISQTKNPIVPSYAPSSPYANAEGFIGVPNIDMTSEAVNMRQAELSYKANIQTLKTAEEMSDALLTLFDEDV